MPKTELEVPPGVKSASVATEVARLWIVDKHLQVIISGDTLKEPRMWGILLADLARHVALSYEANGLDRFDVSNEVMDAFETEWNDSTRDPQELD